MAERSQLNVELDDELSSQLAFTADETRAMLLIWASAEIQEDFKNSKRHTKIWDKISSQLHDIGKSDSGHFKFPKRSNKQVVGVGSIAYFLYIVIIKPFVPDADLQNLACHCTKYDKLETPKFVDELKLLNLLLALVWLVRGLAALVMGAALLIGLKLKNPTLLLVNTICAFAQLGIGVVCFIILYHIEAHGPRVMEDVTYELIIAPLMVSSLDVVGIYRAEMSNGGPRANQNQRRNPNAVYVMPQTTAQPLNTPTHSPIPSPIHNERPKISTTGDIEDPVTDTLEPAPSHEFSKGRKNKKNKGIKGSKSSKKSKKG